MKGSAFTSPPWEGKTKNHQIAPRLWHLSIAARRSPALRALAVLAMVTWTLGSQVRAQWSDLPSVQRVSLDDLVAAMRAEQAKGYTLTATTNGARFQGEVILSLARQARDRDPGGGPLLIDHRDNLQAFMTVTGLTFEELPQFVRLASQHRQDQFIDYREGSVIEVVERGPEPLMALNVRATWPDSLGLPSRFSYHDTLSNPPVRVTSNRVVTYRLVDFGDWILYDEVNGVYGRPTSGVLGFLFRLVGNGRAVQSRIAISSDGLQIVYSVAEKWPFSVKPTVTVFPDGRAENDVLPNRPDLDSIASHIRQPLRIRYRPFGP